MSEMLLIIGLKGGLHVALCNLLAPSLAREALSGVEALAEVIGMPEVTLEAGALHEVTLVPRERVESEGFLQKRQARHSRTLFCIRHWCIFPFMICACARFIALT